MVKRLPNISNIYLCRRFTDHADYKSMKPYIDIAEKAKADAMDAMEKALGKNSQYFAQSR